MKKKPKHINIGFYWVSDDEVFTFRLSIWQYLPSNCDIAILRYLFRYIDIYAQQETKCFVYKILYVLLVVWLLIFLE